MRAGHTEAVIDIARAAVMTSWCFNEIMMTMAPVARLPDLLTSLKNMSENCLYRVDCGNAGMNLSAAHGVTVNVGELLARDDLYDTISNIEHIAL